MSRILFIGALLGLGLFAGGLHLLSVAVAEPLTEEQGDAILEELRQIRQVLEKMQQQGTLPTA